MLTQKMRVVAANRVEAAPNTTTLSLVPEGPSTLQPQMWPVPREMADQFDVGTVLQFSIEPVVEETPAVAEE
jgi:hypothetical protein